MMLCSLRANSCLWGCLLQKADPIPFFTLKNPGHLGKFALGSQNIIVIAIGFLILNFLAITLPSLLFLDSFAQCSIESSSAFCRAHDLYFYWYFRLQVNILKIIKIEQENVSLVFNLHCLRCPVHLYLLLFTPLFAKTRWKFSPRYHPMREGSRKSSTKSRWHLPLIVW